MKNFLSKSMFFALLSLCVVESNVKAMESDGCSCSECPKCPSSARPLNEVERLVQKMRTGDAGPLQEFLMYRDASTFQGVPQDILLSACHQLEREGQTLATAQTLSSNIQCLCEEYHAQAIPIIELLIKNIRNPFFPAQIVSVFEQIQNNFGQDQLIAESLISLLIQTADVRGDREAFLTEANDKSTLKVAASAGLQGSIAELLRIARSYGFDRTQAFVNYQDFIGYTALHEAVNADVDNHRKAVIIRSLLAAGADRTKILKNRKLTAYQLAQEKRLPAEIVELLNPESPECSDCVACPSCSDEGPSCSDEYHGCASCQGHSSADDK